MEETVSSSLTGSPPFSGIFLAGCRPMNLKSLFLFSFIFEELGIINFDTIERWLYRIFFKILFNSKILNQILNCYIEF